MADSGSGCHVRRSTDDAPHQINEVVKKCRQACDSYRIFCDDLNALVKEQDDVFQQHEDLLEEAYGELKVVHASKMSPEHYIDHFYYR